ncbi:response regulator transcription factor [Arcobacteraceae bacterium]|nr:response regulator transcription factor [Arcobacteraceae bacterium]
MKILLLEDNDRLNNSIVKRLELKGYKIDSFTDGHKALDSIYDGYDCFILDINVPSIDGINILKEIREHDKSIPILIISSHIDLDTIKSAYGYGCNDYLKKPFFIDELEVKIEKLCQLEDAIIQLDEDFTYHMEKRELYKDGQIKLTKKETLLLHQLLTHKNKVLSYDHILNYVWEGDIATTDSIRTLVMRLRKKIPQNSLETIVDFGYKFNLRE